jgi:hypothetical protein
MRGDKREGERGRGMDGEAEARRTHTIKSTRAHANCAIHVRDRRWWRVDVAGERQRRNFCCQSAR